jgi:hypothetical protein
MESFIPMSDMIRATHADLLASTALAHIATVGPGGEPQSSPAVSSASRRQHHMEAHLRWQSTSSRIHAQSEGRRLALGRT